MKRPVYGAQMNKRNETNSKLSQNHSILVSSLFVAVLPWWITNLVPSPFAVWF